MARQSKRTPRKHRWETGTAIGLGLFAILLLYLGSRGRWSFLLIGLGIFVFPYVFWTGLTLVFTEAFLRYFVVNRVHERLLPRLLQERFLAHEYFRSGASFPRHLWWRTFQLLFMVSFLATLAVPELPTVESLTGATTQFAGFALVAIALVSLLGPVLGFAWLFQDWGVVGYNSTRGVSSPLGSTLISYVTGFGTLGTIARVAITISTNPTDILGFVFLMLFVVLPACLIVTILFHDRRELKLLRKLAVGYVGTAIPLKSLKIE